MSRERYTEFLRLARYHEGKARSINRFIRSSTFYDVEAILPTEKVKDMIRSNDLDGLKELALGTSLRNRELREEAHKLGIPDWWALNRDELIQAVLAVEEHNEQNKG